MPQADQLLIPDIWISVGLATICTLVIFAREVDAVGTYVLKAFPPFLKIYSFAKYF